MGPGARRWVGLLLLVSAGRGERLPIRIFTTADGLPSEEVNQVLQDSRGFLWLATPEGLARYDGYSFTTLALKDGLPEADVTAFSESRDGRYWVGTRSGYVCRFDPAASRPFRCVRLPQRTRVNVLREDAAGNTWVAANHGVFQLVSGIATPIAKPVAFDEPGRRVKAMGLFVAADGTVWVSTGGTTLYRRHPDGAVDRFPLNPGADDTISTLSPFVQDANGQLWLGTKNGLKRLAPGTPAGGNLVTATYTMQDGLPDNHISAALASPDGSLWLGTEAGLAHFDGSRFQTYTVANGLPTNSIYDLARDRDGNLWGGGDSGGAMRISPGGLRTYGEADGIPAGHIGVFLNHARDACAVRYLPGKAMLRCLGGPPDSAALPLRALFDEEWVSSRAILQDRDGEWWFGTAAGLFRYPARAHVHELETTAPKAIYGRSSGLPGDRVYSLFEDSHGDIWISLQDAQALIVWRRRSGRFETIDTSTIDLPRVATSFGEDASGTLWAGFYKDGPVRLRNGIQILKIHDEMGHAGQIGGFQLDSRQRLWMAGVAGVARIDDPTTNQPLWHLYGTKNGLSSDIALCVNSDLQGLIYVGTPRGLNRIDPETGRVTHYTTLDGLGGNYIDSAVRDRRGSLWFGTRSGNLTRLDPHTEPARPAPTAMITGIRVDGSAVDRSRAGTLVVHPGQKRLEIDYVAVDLSAAQDLSYQYMLRGEDADWSQPTRQRTISYASPPSGSHEFLVRAARGTDASEPASFRFIVEPPVWRRWWFLLSIASLLACFATMVYRQRLRRAVELERVRTRIATDLHDDIGSSLSQIALLSEVARRENGDGEALTRIGTLSRDLVDSMSDVVWAIDPRRDRLTDVVSRMRRFAGDLLGPAAIDYTFEVKLPPGPLKLDPGQRRNVFLIFKEALHNVVKHAHCTRVEIVLTADSGRLRLLVEDDGQGLNPQREGHGLGSMRARAAELGGSLQVGPAGRGGTSIYLDAPLRQGLLSRRTP